MNTRLIRGLHVAAAVVATTLAIGHGDRTVRAAQGGAAAPAVGTSPGGAGAAPPAPAQPASPPGSDFLRRPPVVRLDPAVQQQLFLLPEGYAADLVVADPDVQGPVAVSFDGNGRMYVVEMRSYMRDAAGSNSKEPNSRISRWEDADGDGSYETHRVFINGLVLPRIAFPLQDGVLLVLETDNRDLHKYTDTDGDGVADRKEVFFSNYGRVQNMEWQPGGITWALDNWMYTTYNPFRLRLAADGAVRREETEQNGGQWGNAQDNHGKVWWVDGGGELGPVNFQAPIVYGAFNVPDHFEPGFQVPWGAPGGIADMQGGMNRVRLPDGTLNHFTSAAGPEISRGHRLPADLEGDLLFTEPVGRIVRRAKVVVTDGLTQLRNAHAQSEFVRSTDPLFRPVNVANAPDGTLFVVDMYTGIIQDAQFVGAGSYLRRKIEQYALDKQHNMGRVWRIRSTTIQPDRTRPRMYQESTSELVAHLAHSSGWWRDTAQKLIVLRQDKSVVPALTRLVEGDGGQLTRIHALWSLEGLDVLTPGIVRTLLKDRDAAIRVQAIRASETLFKAGDRSFERDYVTALEDSDPTVVIQAMLTGNLLKSQPVQAAIKGSLLASTSRGVREIAAQVIRPRTALGQQPAFQDPGFGNTGAMSSEERRSFVAGEATFREVCAACHGGDGRGAPVQGAANDALLAPALTSVRVNGHRDYVIRVLLHGLQGPLEGQTFNGGAVMVPMGGNDDQWVADVASYVRNSFGNTGPVVTAAQVAAVRATKAPSAPWAVGDLLEVVPAPLTSASEWRLSASHNGETASNAIGGGARWDTGVGQQPGMWFQVELPQPALLAEIQLESAVRGGRGARGAAAPAGARGAAPAVGRAAGPAPVAGPPAAPAGRGGRGRGGPPAAGPTDYEVQVSLDGLAWQTVATGAGRTPLTTISFPPIRARVVRVTQTGGAQPELWAIQQLRLFEVARAVAAP
jgi:mono/diheme cytochrome c family protein